MKGSAGASLATKSSNLYPPRKIWILGAGHFGFLAAQRLSRRHPEASFLVVDVKVKKLQRIQETFNLPIHVEEAISFVGKSSLPDDVWIIPAVPFHVAFLWILDQLNKTGQAVAVPIPVPGMVELLIPNPYRATGGTLYASYATFLCPDSCNEPDEMCTHTREARRGNLFEDLRRIAVPGFKVIVVQSRQLAPGVGGYSGLDLKGTLSDVTKAEGAFLIATSCRCHGVLDGLRWKEGGR